jgi:type III pantothenate kinase
MENGVVRYRWRITTKSRTTDELGMLLLQLFQVRGLTQADITGVCVSCVVPSVLYAIEKASRRYLKVDAFVVGKGIKTGMRICTDNPQQIGADRIVNAVAAYQRYPQALVVIDFGTATTLDCVNSQGEYLGGAIAPGFQIALDALFVRTAKLPKVEVEKTASVIGKNTIHSMQAGMFWGYVGLVNELASRCKQELQDLEPNAEIQCIATGGLANLVGSDCTEIDTIEDHLTLYGLWDLYCLNHK